jgi:hypothetical protein
MSSTLRFAFAFASITTAGLALAPAAHAQQGPGSCDCAIPAVVAAPAAAPLPRWGIGLHLASMGLAPEDSPDDQTQFGGGGLQLRYRLAPRWQLELSVAHLREQLEDGTEGERELDTGTIAALYHFRPHARWDWYVLAGVGATADGNPDLSDEEREKTARAHGVLGVGVERHFGRLGIGAELRAIGIAPPEDDDQAEPAPAGMTIPTADDGKGTSGGQLTVAATFYF